MKPNLVLILVVLISLIASPAIGSRINSKLYDRSTNDQPIDESNDVVALATDHAATTTNDGDTSAMVKQPRKTNSVPYIKTSIPIRIFQCMQHLSILKCMKIFILQRMERTPIYANSGNLTTDFLDQLLTNDNQSNSGHPFDRYYMEMDDGEINERLVKSFQRFFKDREIKLHFIPGMVVRVVPSEENSINLSLKRVKCKLNIHRNKYPLISDSFFFQIANAVEFARKKNRPGEYLLNLGVPALMMPAIFVGTFLPFILPALKMAAMFSGFINHAALLAALAYTAKNAAFQSVEAHKHLFYNHRSGAL